MTFARVSFIIPALNEERHIGRCLLAIAALRHTDIDMEVIVVDNGSTDRTTEIAKERGATVLVKADAPVSALRNYGVASCRGDLIACVDADCAVDPGWLEEGLSDMARGTVDMVGSAYAVPDDAGWIGRINDLVQNKKADTGVKYIPAGNMLVKRACFEALGGFDESLETSEDVDLCRRLRRSGYTLLIDQKVRSTHYGTPARISEMLRREVWHGKTMFTLLYRDFMAVRNLRLASYVILNTLLLVGIAVGGVLALSGRPKALIISLSAYVTLTLIVAIRDWTSVKERFVQLFFYTAMYGVARSVSLAKWLASGLKR